MNDVDRRIAGLVAYLHRKRVDAVKIARTLAWLLRQPGAGITKQAHLARRLRKTKTWVCNMLAILRLPKDVQERVGTSQRRLSLDALWRIARLGDEPQRRELSEALLAGASNREIRRRIAAWQNEQPESLIKEVFRSLAGFKITAEIRARQVEHECLIQAVREFLAYLQAKPVDKGKGRSERRIA